MSTFGWSSSQAYAHEGFSGMNGRTDTAEYFYQSDFQTVLSFARVPGWAGTRSGRSTGTGNATRPTTTA